MQKTITKFKFATVLAALFLAACGADSLETAEQTLAPVAQAGKAALPRWLEDKTQSAGAALQPDANVSAATEKADDQLKRLLGGDGRTVSADKFAIPPKNDPNFIVRALADFDGDGKADVLWQTSGGDTYIARMNGAVAESCAKMGIYSASVMGTGDFNGDGKADIVWRNMSTGAVSISIMNGSTVSQWLSVGASPIALNVKLEGIGDFDGNGRADMLWRNQSTGRSVMSYHNADGSVASWPVVSNFINPATTTALKVGDINGDGKDDIVWRNMSTGNVVISLMDGSTPTWTGITASPIHLSVALEAIGDFDNNGKADLLWRNTVTGRSLMSYHNADGSVASWPVVSNFINPASTSAVGVGDLDGDGKSDIFWRNLMTGNSVVSLMNGSTPNWLATDFSAGCSVPRLNDTGSAGAMCYQPGSDALVACTSAAAQALNPKQDGMIGRDVASNSGADGRLGFSYTKISNTGAVLPNTAVLGSGPSDWACTRDNVSGLIWEVKLPPDGNYWAVGRQIDRHYVNYDSTQLMQITDYSQGWPALTRYPTQAQITDSNNSVGYINYVNQQSLCGFTDWRLPMIRELHGLMDYSVQTQQKPLIDENWFPNSVAPGWGGAFWTSESLDYSNPNMGYTGADYQTAAWAVDFVNHGAGSVTVKSRSGSGVMVRLVRGALPQEANRYILQADGVEVKDKLTGLVWKRCLEGMTWNGSGCAGDAIVFDHESALAYARDQQGWRLPNVKELASIVDKTNPMGLNPTIFPNMPAYGKSWSSTPVLRSANGFAPGYQVWLVRFKWGGQVHYDYDGRHSSMLRLVKD
jgi:Protein of unknown function (DUF1566)/FG-GAP-like repeat/FG-GAP repeat